MDPTNYLLPCCPVHGKPTQRASCRQCNAAYMRGYLRRRRQESPGRSLWDRALKRAKASAISFALPRDSLSVPRSCPALGIKITAGRGRSDGSPSLDRIVPQRGYVPDNVRVISDRANRLKGDRDAAALRRLAETGPSVLREEYALLATYVEREELLAEIRIKAAQGGRVGEEWGKIAAFLDRLFRRSLIS